jgi:pilus assembly protein CpaF
MMGTVPAVDLEELEEELAAEGVAIPGFGAEGEELEDFVRSISLVLARKGRMDPQEAARWAALRITGLGILQDYLEVDGVEEIAVRSGRISLYRDGRWEETGRSASESYWNRLARRVVESRRIGRPLGPHSPMAVVGLPQGYRLSAAVPPASRTGTLLNLRRFLARSFPLSAFGITGEKLSRYLSSPAGKSFLISGTMGTGKTSLLNTLLRLLPSGTHLAVVEGFQELAPDTERLNVAHVTVREEEGASYTMADVVDRQVSRMRPDYIAVGEIVGPEAVPFLRGLHLGVAGAATIHGRSALDALYRLEDLTLSYGPNRSERTVRRLIARALDMVIHLERKGDRRQALCYLVEEQDGEYRLERVSNA